MALLQILKDVVEETASYKAVLVYDVSRWGDFRTSTRPHLCRAASASVPTAAKQNESGVLRTHSRDLWSDADSVVVDTRTHHVAVQSLDRMDRYLSTGWRNTRLRWA
jgi:hypothetical protein